MDVHIRVDLDDEGPVVVKSATGAAVERLAHERERLVRAAHPGVVSLASGSGEGALVTRYAGEPLTRWSGTVADVAGLGVAVAGTLADLHDMGVVHGRLDDSHILIGDDGRPRLCGLSHAGDAAAADDVAALGVVLGALVDRVPAGRRAVLGRRDRGGLLGRGGNDRRAVREVLERATDPVPTRRPTARALADALLTAVPQARLPAAAEPDTLDRIWAHAGAESDDERWAAALGSGPPDLPVAAHDRTARLPTAPLDTPGWPTTGLVDEPLPDHPDGASRGGPGGMWHVPVVGQTAGDGLRSPAAGGVDDDRRRPADSPLDDPRGEALTRELRVAAAGRVTPLPRSQAAESALTTGPRRAGRWIVALAAGGLVVAAVVTTATAALGSGGGAGAPRSEASASARCPAVAGPAADVDGDGCPEALVVDGGTVDAGVARWSLGKPGDLVTVGDWDCDGEASAALLRPATGDVFVFAAWARTGEPVTVSASGRVAGGVGIHAEPDGEGCDRLLVDLGTGGTATVEVSG